MIDWITIGVIIYLVMTWWVFLQFKHVANERLKHTATYRAGYAISAFLWPVLMFIVIKNECINRYKRKESH